jgi:hypothetical protein
LRSPRAGAAINSKHGSPGAERPQALSAGRVLPFNEKKASLVWATLMADGKMRGRPRSALDTIIAAIAKANDCVVVTDNEKDFEGVESIQCVRPLCAILAARIGHHCRFLFALSLSVQSESGAIRREQALASCA